MLKTVLLAVSQLFTVCLLADATPTFHSVSPEKGDGIYSLLRRFDLEKACNQDQFLALNDLTTDSELQGHAKYKLPVYIYKFDGKSIRSTIGDDDWDKAVRIKRYNEWLKAQGLRSSTYAKSKILWVPYHEIHCPESSEAPPVVAEAVAVPHDNGNARINLFGEKYADFKILDESLKDKVYYVVSGHGGPDPGARCVTCPSTLCEDEYAYDIALRLTRNLMQHGATVHMIVQDSNDGIRDEKYLDCDRDETVAGKELPLKQKPRLVQRASEINQLYRKYQKEGKSDQVAIFLHVDSNSEHKQQDVFFYHHKTSKSGKKLAKQIRDTFDKKYKKYQRDRGYKGYVKPRGLYVLNFTQPTSVFVELANIRNRADHPRLLLHTNRQAVANWLFDGLIAN